MVLSVALLVLGGAGAGIAGSLGHDASHFSPSKTRPSARQPQATNQTPKGTTELVWIDYSGGLRVGNPSQGTNRLVAQTSADPTTRLIVIRDRVYFIESAPGDGYRSKLEEFNVSTNRLRSLGAAVNVTKTVNGRELLVAVDPRHLVEMSPRGVRLSPVWNVPSGYTLETYLAQHPLVAVAGGIVVESARPVALSRGNQAPDAAYSMAIWNISSDSIRSIGQDVFVIGAYTRHGANHSLLAWVDASGVGEDANRLAITNTATLRTTLIASPLRATPTEFGNNFLGGGAFSPDGHWLAAFVTTIRPHDWPNAQLVLVNPDNSSVQLVSNTVVQIGEPQGWVTWSPTGTALFGGSYREGAILQAFEYKTGNHQAMPLTLDQNANDDVTVSAVAVHLENNS